MAKENEYARIISRRLYVRLTKAVLAALVVSLMFKDGHFDTGVSEAVLREWWRLYDAHIVPQRPPMYFVPAEAT